MPRANRVDPWGGLIATPARGEWMGNRGRLHDPAGRLTGRRWTTRAWICCRLSFKGRRRPVSPPGRYTALFFLDEATALAAGHRPCGECRREDLATFKSAWLSGNGSRPAVAAIDATLHRERTARWPWRGERPRAVDPSALPDGAMIALDETEPWLVWGDRLWRWTPFGYHHLRPRRDVLSAPLITPPSIVRALAGGYRPVPHPSLGEAAQQA
jgi:hypothetical protein